VNYLTEL